MKAEILSEFELVVLPMEAQQKIAQLHLLAKKENQLLKELADQKERYYAGLLDQTYKSAKRGK